MLGVRSPVGPPRVLALMFVVLSDEHELWGLFLRALVVRGARVSPCSTDVGASRVARSFLGVGSAATDSLRSAPIVADCTFALYSAAMRSATGATHATRC